MKIYQICFSPTGGTKKIADFLCSAWGVQAEPIDLMQHVGPLLFSEEDFCLIAVSVYGGRAPETALRGLRAMRGNGIPTVLVAVYGNRAVDDALLELRDETHAAGFQCIAAIAAVARHSLFPQFGENRPDRQDEKELESFAQQILEALECGKDTEPERLPGHRPYRTYDGVPMKPRADFHCTACGLCARECPAQAIPRDEPKKPDRRKCISCMHCVSICPNEARHCKELMMTVARRKLSDACSGRKPNVLYL